MAQAEYKMREHLITAAHAQFPYLISNVVMQISTDTKKVSCGGLAGGSSSVIVTGAPVTKKLLTFTLMRVNAVPDLPYIISIYKDNSTDVIEESNIQVGAPVLHPDGMSTIYQVAGSILYISNSVYDPATSFTQFPLSPIDGNRQVVPVVGGGNANNLVHHGGSFNSVWPYYPPESKVNLTTNTATSTSTSGPNDTIGG